jgi:hypothetical protein
VLLSLLAIFLAYFSWRYVETPFRDKSKFGKKQIFLLTAIGSFLFITLGLIGNAKKGFELRLDNEQRHLLSFNSYNFKEIYRQGECFLNPEQSYASFKKFCYTNRQLDSILIWGDSHAAALSFGIRKNFNNVSQYTASGCPPLLGVAISWRPMCLAINKFVSEEIALRKPSVIVLHSNWLLYEDQKPFNSLGSTVDFIKRMPPESEIIVVGGVPQYMPTLPTYMLNKRIQLFENARISSPNYEKVAFTDSQLKALSIERGVRFFSSLDSFCTNANCLVTSRFEGDIMPMAWDYGHLTSAGSAYLSAKFKSFYEEK